MAIHSKWSSGHLIFYDGTTQIMEIKNGSDGVDFPQGISSTGGFTGNVTYPTPATTTGATGNITLTSTSNRVQFVGTTSSGINLYLPGSTSNAGKEFKIFVSSSTGAVLVKDAVTSGTIVTLGANEGAICVSNGTTWRGFVGGIT